MQVIFLVSLLQTSNKYKSTAIFVLPTFCFHFIVVFLTVSLPPPTKYKASFRSQNAKQAATFLGNTQGSFAAPAPGTQSTFVPSRQNQVCLGSSMRANSELWPTWQNFAR